MTPKDIEYKSKSLIIYRQKWQRLTEPSTRPTDHGWMTGMVIGRDFTDRYPLGMLCAGYRHRSAAVGSEPIPTRGRYQNLISYRFSCRYELSPIPIISRRFQTSAVPYRYLPTFRC